MNKKRINRDEVRESSFPVVSTKAEKEAYAQAAAKMGLSRSAWVRMILNKEIERSKKR